MVHQADELGIRKAGNVKEKRHSPRGPHWPYDASVRLTLDTHCLTELENRSGQTTAIWELITLHRAGQIQLFVSAISPAENPPGTAAPENDRQLEDRLKALGINDLPSVLPTGRNEMSFWGAAVYGDDNDRLAEKIRSVLHSTVDTLFLTSRARTVLCDVEGLAAHIRSGHDIFVTSNSHFLKDSRRQPLLALGARDILTPEEALAKVAASR